MATRKRTAANSTPAPSVPSEPKARIARKARPTSHATPRVRTVAARGFDAATYLGPGAALLTTGVVAAAGYVLREQLAGVLSTALKSATVNGSKAVDAARGGAHDAVEKMTEALSLDTLLRRAGLQRRSNWSSISGPAIGAICGFAVGSIVTHLFGRQLIDQLMGASETPSDAPTASIDETGGARSSASSVVDEMQTGGNAHRGVS